jgi:hypothetical protein
VYFRSIENTTQPMFSDVRLFFEREADGLQPAIIRASLATLAERFAYTASRDTDS